MWKGGQSTVADGTALGLRLPPPMVDCIQFDLSFPVVSKAYAATFFVTLLLGALVTFMATDFNMQSDKIIQYYGFFNPCLLFDHYPAKALSMAGMGFFVCIGLLFSFMFFVYVYIEPGMATTLWTALIVAYVSAAQLIFVNVFTVNMYPERLPARRLHGFHASLDDTVSLMEKAAEFDSMSKTDISLVELHTAFYILWILAELILMVHLASKFFHASSRQWRMWGYLAIGIFGAGFHAFAMLVMILQNRPKVDWYFRQGGLNSQLEWVIVWIDAKTFTSLWGWLPIMFYRHWFSEGHTLRFTLSLYKTEDDLGSLQPGLWLGRALRGMSCILLLGSIFTPNFVEDQSTLFKLAGAWRQKPFGYFAAPAYLGTVVFLGVSTGLSVMHERLLHGKVQWRLVWTGMLNVFAAFACSLVVLEEERFTHYFFLVSISSFGAYIILLVTPHGRLWDGVTYVAGGAVILISAFVANLWPLYLLFVLWMPAAERVIRHESVMYVSVARLEASSYQTLSGSPPAGERPSGALHHQDAGVHHFGSPVHGNTHPMPGFGDGPPFPHALHGTTSGYPVVGPCCA